jgi:hypothetical protein
MESGLGISTDDPFDPSHAVIGSLGQATIKSTGIVQKKKRERDKDRDRGGEGENGENGGNEVKKSKAKKSR